MASSWNITISSRLSLFLRVILLMVFIQGNFSHKLTSQDIEDIVKFVEHTRECRNATGLTLSIVQDGEVVLSRGFGFADVEKEEKVTAQTPFPIGSVSKNFVSTLLAIQLTEGKLNIDWDTPLHCFPKSEVAFSDAVRTSQTNLRDILAHKTGLPGYFWTLLTGLPESVTRKDMVRRIQFMEPHLPFRTGFHYNNFMYGLAAHMAEVLADNEADWELLNQERFFKPAGMKNSGYIDRTPNPPGLAQPYTVINGSLYKIGTEGTRFVHPLGPAGSIFSTADDMTKWIQFHLAVLSRMNPSSGPPLPFPGNLTLADAAVMKVWETYQSQNAEPLVTIQLTKPTFPVADVHLAYAMGWFNGIYRGYRKLSHAGGVSTYMSLLQLLPDLRSGIFISNSGPGGLVGDATSRVLAAYITDKITGEIPWLDSSSVCTFPAPWFDMAAVLEAHELAKANIQPFEPPVDTQLVSELGDECFAGTYSHLALGEILIYVEHKILYLKYGRFGHAHLMPTSMTGLFEASFLDELWVFSGGFGLKMKVQFVNVRMGKAQELLVEVDPMMAPRTFIRDLNLKKPPKAQVRWENLMECPGKETCSKHIWN